MGRCIRGHRVPKGIVHCPYCGKIVISSKILVQLFIGSIAFLTLGVISILYQYKDPIIKSPSPTLSFTLAPSSTITPSRDPIFSFRLTMAPLIKKDATQLHKGLQSALPTLNRTDFVGLLTAARKPQINFPTLDPRDICIQYDEPEDETISRADDILNIVKSSPPIYGPEGGSLTKIEDKISVYKTEEIYDNFVAEVNFISPDTIGGREWDFGIDFRNNMFLIPLNDEDEDHLYRLAITSEGYWELHEKVIGDGYTIIGVGQTCDLNKNNNKLSLIAHGKIGYFLLNETLVSEIDLSRWGNNGNIMVTAGIFSSTLKQGEVTRFEDFQIWSIPESLFP